MGVVCSELGVLTWTQIETEEYETNEFLNNVKKDRGYNYEEVLTVAPGKIPNFEANTKKFYTEHLHEHEEIRFILDGVGMCSNFYFTPYFLVDPSSLISHRFINTLDMRVESITHLTGIKNFVCSGKY